MARRVARLPAAAAGLAALVLGAAVLGACAELAPVRRTVPVEDPASPRAPEAQFVAPDNPLAADVPDGAGGSAPGEQHEHHHHHGSP